jgi:hypothetical protein
MRPTTGQPAMRLQYTAAVANSFKMIFTAMRLANNLRLLGQGPPLALPRSHHPQQQTQPPDISQTKTEQSPNSTHKSRPTHSSISRQSFISIKTITHSCDEKSQKDTQSLLIEHTYSCDDENDNHSTNISSYADQAIVIDSKQPPITTSSSSSSSSISSNNSSSNIDTHHHPHQSSHPIPLHPIPSHPIPAHSIPSHPIPSHPIPIQPIRSDNKHIYKIDDIQPPPSRKRKHTHIESTPSRKPKYTHIEVQPHIVSRHHTMFKMKRGDNIQLSAVAVGIPVSYSTHSSGRSPNIDVYAIAKEIVQVSSTQRLSTKQRQRRRRDTATLRHEQWMLQSVLNNAPAGHFTPIIADTQHGFVMPRYRCDLRTALPIEGTETIHRCIKAMATSVQYLHNKGFRHGDLKCGNYLMDNSNLPVLADFGLSYEVTSSASHGLVYGTSGFRHPLRPTAKCLVSVKDHFKYDIFQLGMTVVAVLLGRPVFTSSSVSHFANICRSSGSVTDFVMTHERSDCPMRQHTLCETARFNRPQHAHIWTCLDSMLPTNIEGADVNDMISALNELTTV